MIREDRRDWVAKASIPASGSSFEKEFLLEPGRDFEPFEADPTVG